MHSPSLHACDYVIKFLMDPVSMQKYTSLHMIILDDISRLHFQ
jgi:hypothetical protein